MNRRISLKLLLLLLVSSALMDAAHAQSRNQKMRRLVLEDNTTHTLTIESNTLSTDASYIFPQPGAGVLQSNVSGTLSLVAPGSSGNVLVSNGTSWASSAGTFGVTAGAGLTGGSSSVLLGSSTSLSLDLTTNNTWSGTHSFSNAAPIKLTNAAPVATLATTGVNGVLTIKDAENTPNTLLTLTDNGATGTLAIANFTGALTGNVTGNLTGNVTSSSAVPLVLSNLAPVVTLATAGNNGTLTVKDGDENTLMTLTDNATSGTLTVANFTGALTGNVTGNVTGNLTGNVTASSAAPLLLSNAAPVVTLASTNVDGVLTIKDAQGSPNTLLTLADNGTSGTLTVANVAGALTGNVTGNVTGNLTGNVTASSAAPILLSNAAPVITLASTGVDGVLRIKDAQGSPNTLLTLTDNGTSGTLAVTNLRGTLSANLNDVFKRRNDDTSIVSNNTTTASDSSLKFSVSANEYWAVQGMIYFLSSDATPDLKIAFAIPSGSMAIGYMLNNGSAASGNNGVLTSSATLTANIPVGANIPQALFISGTVAVGNAGGNLQFLWRPNASDTHAMFLKAGSYLRFTKL